MLIVAATTRMSISEPGFNPYTEKVDQWVKEHPIKPPTEMLEQASRAIDLVLRKKSELRELWEESESVAEEWRAG